MKQSPTPKKKLNTGLVAVLIAALAFTLFTNLDAKTPEEKRKQLIEKQFSSINGEHINLTRLIKAGMHNADSYKHIETNYFDLDTAIIVNERYSGENAFGARVQGFVKAKVDSIGNIISVLEQR